VIRCVLDIPPDPSLIRLSNAGSSSSAPTILKI
jgi:hypothetical protein